MLDLCKQMMLKWNAQTMAFLGFVVVFRFSALLLAMGKIVKFEYVLDTITFSSFLNTFCFEEL